MPEVPPNRALQFKALVLEYGPVPPSGGPERLRYLTHHGRQSLERFEAEMKRALEILAKSPARVPRIDFALTESDDEVRSAIHERKRQEWAKFKSSTDTALLKQAEPHVRGAVDFAIAALNFLEDHALCEDAHEAVHQAAFLQRGLYGCPIVIRENSYWTNCPVNISHIRVGLSVGMVVDYSCSICGRMAEDCDHVIGQAYEVVATRTDVLCSICDAEVCGHIPGQNYVAVAKARTTNAVMHETSFVKRPRYPRARIVEMTVNCGDEGDDPRFFALAGCGALDCDAELGPCNGWNEDASAILC